MSFVGSPVPMTPFKGARVSALGATSVPDLLAALGGSGLLSPAAPHTCTDWQPHSLPRPREAGVTGVGWFLPLQQPELTP